MPIEGESTVNKINISQ